MTTQELIELLRSRINPAYTTQIGTESHERALCIDALQRQVLEIERERKSRQAAQIENEALKARLAKAPKVAQPLSDEWIRERCNQTWVFSAVKEWVRMIEKAHNIGGQQP